MNKTLAFFLSFFLINICHGQNWVSPPDTVYYNYQNRYVEIILPKPTLKAKVVSNGIKLYWSEYWDQNFLNQYKQKFGYEAKPNRFSFYRSDVGALGGVPFRETEYIDKTVERGKTYSYQFLASDVNYQDIGGLQHWSPRSSQVEITYSNNQNPPIPPPSVEDIVLFKEYKDSTLKLWWNVMPSATKQNLLKAHNSGSGYIYTEFKFDGAVSTYQDDELVAGDYYVYRLKIYKHNTMIGESQHTDITVPSTLGGKDNDEIIGKFTILPAYPNPFNPSTTTRYGITSDSKVNISIYDISGRLVRTLVDTDKKYGWHSISWNGTNDYGQKVPAGIYLSRVKSGNKVKTSKLMLLK